MMAVDSKSRGIALAQVLEGILPSAKCPNIEVRNLSLNSQNIQPGDVFVALRGTADHGLRFYQQAVSAGAVAVFSDPNDGIPDTVFTGAVPVIEIENLRTHLGAISNRVYGNPSLDVKTICVTGTNGKTTIAHIVCAALNHLQGDSAYVGTLGIGLWGEFSASINTTPDLLTLQRHLAEWRDRGVKYCALEASSHALEQGRLDDISIGVAIFTNLTHEHLDYHGTMENYGRAKKRLFQKDFSHAVINVDDSFGRELCKALSRRKNVWPFSLDDGDGKQKSDFENLTTASVKKLALSGIEMVVRSPFGRGKICAPLIGAFNASNLLAAFTSLAALGWTFEQIAEALALVPAVPGRMEVVNVFELADVELPTVVVDYAHSPDGLQQALVSLRELTNGRLTCVFGCGGDRDSSKRAMMGRIAEKYADNIVITNDNPRTESPQKIVQQILNGVQNIDKAIIETDRRKAIFEAIKHAATNDVVLIAGKGHEHFQQLGKEKIPFSDQACSRAALQLRAAEATP